MDHMNRIYMCRVCTRQFPWLDPIQVNLSNGSAREVALMNLGLEVEGDYLLIARVEPKPWRQLKAILDAHPFWLHLLSSHASLLIMIRITNKLSKQPG